MHHSLSSDKSTLHCTIALHCTPTHFYFQSQCTALPVFPQIISQCTMHNCAFTFLHNVSTALPVIKYSNQSTVISLRCHMIVSSTPLLRHITDTFAQKTANTLQLATPSINQQCRHRFQFTLMQIHPLDECLCTLKWHKVAKI